MLIYSCLYKVERTPLFTSTDSLSLLINPPPFHLPSADYSQAHSHRLSNFLRRFGLYTFIYKLNAAVVHCMQSIFIYVCCSWLCSERLERGGPCSLLKNCVKWGLKEYIWKGVGWLVGLVVPVQEIFFPAMAALGGSVQKKIFLAVYYFTSFVPIAQQAGQTVSLYASLVMLAWPPYLNLSVP